MDKSIFIKKIFEDVNFLIENYLNNGQFVSYEKWGELDGFVYEKYPFLSIAFLVKANSSENDYYEFISRYKDSISLEVKKIKDIFLTDVDDEIKKLENENNELTKRCESFQITINKMETQYAESEQHLKASIEEIESLKKRITILEMEKPVVNVLTKSQIVAIWSNFYSLPYINDNAIINETFFDIEGFIEDLSTKFSIYITSEELLSNNTLKKIVDLLRSKQSHYKDDFNKLLKQYPHKKELLKEINVNNVTQIILNCCPKKNGATPKYVFGTDTLENAKLDVDKLNSVLYYNFGLKWSSVASIRSAKNIDELKVKILGWQNNKISPTTAIASSRGIAAGVTLASRLENLKFSHFFHPKKKMKE